MTLGPCKGLISFPDTKPVVVPRRHSRGSPRELVRHAPSLAPIQDWILQVWDGIQEPPHGQSPQVTLWQAVRPQGVLHTHGPLTEGSLASLSADLGVSSSQGKKALFPSV